MKTLLTLLFSMTPLFVQAGEEGTIVNYLQNVNFGEEGTVIRSVQRPGEEGTVLFIANKEGVDQARTLLNFDLEQCDSIDFCSEALSVKGNNPRFLALVHNQNDTFTVHFSVMYAGQHILVRAEDRLLEISYPELFDSLKSSFLNKQNNYFEI